LFAACALTIYNRYGIFHEGDSSILLLRLLHRLHLFAALEIQIRLGIVTVHLNVTFFCKIQLGPHDHLPNNLQILLGLVELLNLHYLLVDLVEPLFLLLSQALLTASKSGEHLFL
jgi:hypothetical protein